MALLTRGTKGIAEFGVAKSPASYVIAATLAGIVVGGALAYLTALYPAPSPLDGFKSGLCNQKLFCSNELRTPLNHQN
jgi:hypothetical protein